MYQCVTKKVLFNIYFEEALNMNLLFKQNYSFNQYAMKMGNGKLLGKKIPTTLTRFKVDLFPVSWQTQVGQAFPISISC